MGKPVYLWELDSVRNSKEECAEARCLLYRELMINGNDVVISFNQLVDGRWVRPFLTDDKQFSFLLQLFQTGAIKTSQYYDEGNLIRVASQYMQNALENRIKNNQGFRFSGMLIDAPEQKLLNEILLAIRYNDAERLRELEFDATTEQKEWAYKYVKLILLISEKKISCNPARRDATSYEKIMNSILHIDVKLLCKSNPIWKDLYLSASECLLKIYNELETEGATIKKRATWYRKIVESDTKLNNFEHMLVDICYNYTIESSIEGIECAYDIGNEYFTRDVIKKIQKHYDCYILEQHDCSYELDKMLDWSRLVEIRQDIQLHYRKKNIWSKNVRATQLVNPTLLFSVNAVTFLGLNSFMEKMQECSNEWVVASISVSRTIGWAIRVGIIILAPFVYDIIENKVSELLGLSDTVENVKKIGRRHSNQRYYNKMCRLLKKIKE